MSGHLKLSDGRLKLTLTFSQKCIKNEKTKHMVEVKFKDRVIVKVKVTVQIKATAKVKEVVKVNFNTMVTIRAQIRVKVI